MTNTECQKAINEIYGAIGRRVKQGIFQWLSGGVAVALVLILGFTYNVSCTANNTAAKMEGNTNLLSTHYKAIHAQNKEMRADIKSLREETKALYILIYEREASMLMPDDCDPVTLPLGYAE